MYIHMTVMRYPAASGRKVLQELPIKQSQIRTFPLDLKDDPGGADVTYATFVFFSFFWSILSRRELPPRPVPLPLRYWIIGTTFI